MASHLQTGQAQLARLIFFRLFPSGRFGNQPQPETIQRALFHRAFLDFPVRAAATVQALQADGPHCLFFVLHIAVIRLHHSPCGDPFTPQLSWSIFTLKYLLNNGQSPAKRIHLIYSCFASIQDCVPHVQPKNSSRPKLSPALF
jgi:hypothetical protein